MFYYYYLFFTIALSKLCLDNNNYCIEGYYDDEYAYFTITTTSTGWAAVGLNTVPFMSGTDANMGWVESDGSVTIVDRHNIEYSSFVDAQQDTILIPEGSGRHNGIMTLNMKKKLNTGDPDDLQIFPQEAQNWIFAYCNTQPFGSGINAEPSHHDFRYPSDPPIQFLQPKPVQQIIYVNGTNGTNATIVYSNGNSSQLNVGVIGFTSALTPYDQAIQGHGVLMFLIYNVLFPIAIFLVMFEKDGMPTSWKRYHVLINLTSVLLMFISGILAVSNTTQHLSQLHHFIGWLTMILTFLMMPLGMIALKKYNHKSKQMSKQGKLHRYIGWFAMLLSLISMPTGIFAYNPLYMTVEMKAMWFIWTFIIVAPLFVVRKLFQDDAAVDH